MKSIQRTHRSIMQKFLPFLYIYIYILYIHIYFKKRLIVTHENLRISQKVAQFMEIRLRDQL